MQKKIFKKKKIKPSIPYITNMPKTPGTSYSEIEKNARHEFNEIKRGVKRKPSIISAYFKKKVFFDSFWTHLFQKNRKERLERLKFFRPAIEIIRKSKNQPEISENPVKKHEIFYRFSGISKEGELFYVQIKENKKSGRRYFMSCFPK